MAKPDASLITLWTSGTTPTPTAEEAVTRGNKREVRRVFYERKAIFDLRQIQEGVGGKALVGSDALEDRVKEPLDLDCCLRGLP